MRAAPHRKKACHPERSGGGNMGVAQSKDLSLFLIRWRAEIDGDPSTSLRSAQDDNAFVWMERCAPRHCRRHQNSNWSMFSLLKINGSPRTMLSPSILIAPSLPASNS